MNKNEAETVVQELNEAFFDRNGNDSVDFFPFSFSGTGLFSSISFCGYRVWSDDDDPRIWIDDEDRPEPLINCVIREARKIQSLVAISLPPAGSP